MAFNLNFWKGTTPLQAKAALEYWKTAFISADDAEKLKAEKKRQIEENAATAEHVEPVAAENTVCEHHGKFYGNN